MKKFFFVILLFVTVTVNAQLFIPTSGPSAGMETSDFVFVEGDLMFTGYGYNLLRSDNGGQSWYIVTSNFADIEMLPTSMIRKGEYIFLSSWLGDRCYRSDDNGDTWDVMGNGLPYSFGYPAASPNQIEASGDNLIMSSNNFTAISTDLGLNWVAIEANEYATTDGLQQLPSGLYMSASNISPQPNPARAIYKSLDNGITWETLAGVPYIETTGLTLLQGSRAFAEMNGYIYSATSLSGNGLMRSNDNGATWEIVGESYAFDAGTCIRNYDGVLYFTDMTGAYKSSDEGTTWEEILDASYYNGAGAGFIAKNDNKIWISTGKGPISYDITTGAISNPAIPNASLTNMLAGNGVILGLQNGQLYSSTNFGNSWSDITANVGDGVGVLNISLDGNDWYAHSMQNGVITLFTSNDNGATWQAITTLPGGGGGSAFYSYNPQFYAKGLGNGIVIYKSNDDGVTWNESNITVIGDPLDANAQVQAFEKQGDILFADITNGFAFSTDAGATWTARKLTSDFKVVGWNNLFIRLHPNGGAAIIQKSTDNGATWATFLDGFPSLAGSLAGAAGLGMVNGRVYIHNAEYGPFGGAFPGFYYYLDQSSTQWTVAENLGQIPFATLSLTGTAENDLYISTIGHGVWANAEVLGIENAESDNLSISVYPNPANSTIHVTCDINNGVFSIVDISGKVVLQNTFLNGNQMIDITSLNSGFYFIQVKGNNTNAVVKFVKE
jgi:hypothetical protein